MASSGAWLTPLEEVANSSPAGDEIIFQFYDNDDTMVQALKNGDVDYISGIPINLFKSLKNQEGIETNSAPDPGFTELGFNLYEPSPEVIEEFDAPKTTTGNPALLDPRVREAINWAIDEKALTEKVLQGEGVPGSTLVPRCSPSTIWSWTNPSCRASTFSAPKSCWSRPDGRTPTATGSWTRTGSRWSCGCSSVQRTRTP